MKSIIAEYIWIDGYEPESNLRSKTKVFKSLNITELSSFPDWGCDGSSTQQADGSKSDIILKPVSYVKDPLRSENCYLVLCETFNSDGTPAKNNHRAKLRETSEKYSALVPFYGFEQEYFLVQDGKPFCYADANPVKLSGQFYCGVGADRVFGRPIMEEHLKACVKAELGITGTNIEVAPAQFEYQIFGDALTACDHLWIARWLLNCIAEKHNVSVSLAAKLLEWENGSGMHTNFSTKEMRDGVGAVRGIDFINVACEAIGKKIPDHLTVYGVDNDKRLTGKHETCSINEFRYGVSDRGASIRIPLQVAQDERGYLEDRRPAANADPYQVAEILLSTVGQAYIESTLITQ